MEDKWRKLTVGMVRAGELQPQFLMIMDADDLVSNRLVAFALDNADSNGWDFDMGYRYSMGSKWILRQQHGFSAICGTSAILNAKRIDFPKDVSEQSRTQCIALKWGHGIIAQKMVEVGFPLTPLPFPGAIYVESHGDNDSHMGVTKFKWPGWRKFTETAPYWRPCTSRLRQEFSLPPYPHSPDSH